jgi:uncharacterized protein (TIGR02996 family)
MHNEDALLAAICANPEEDTPRLVFADWLSELGGNVNTGWATLIRNQIRLASGASDATGELFQRVRMFQSAYWKNLILTRLGLCSVGISFDTWERGFPTYLAGDHPTVREIWPRVAYRVPTRRLRLGGSDDDAVEDLVTWPELRRVVSLELITWDDRYRRARRIGDRALIALSGCPAFAALEVLTMEYIAITDAGADALVSSPHLEKLQDLRMRRSHSDPQPSEEAQLRLRARFGAGGVL